MLWCAFSQVTQSEDEEEDLIEKEKREEQERLRVAGIRQRKLEAERKAEDDRWAIASLEAMMIK
jgi:hypothetical protein